MTQTGLISFLALALDQEQRYTRSANILCRPNLAGLNWLTFIAPAVTHWQVSTDLRLNLPVHSLLLVLLPVSDGCRQGSHCPSSPLLSDSKPLSPWSSLILTWGNTMCHNNCVSTSVFLCISLSSPLQGDHRPEAKMHWLSHRDVRFGPAGCWDHRSSSGGEVSETNTSS